MMARAIGAATRLPLEPFSTITATAICGFSTGAKDMNRAWSRSRSSISSSSYSYSCATLKTCAVPLLPAIVYGASAPTARAVPRMPCNTSCIAWITVSQ